jgi:IS30 family transposase
MTLLCVWRFTSIFGTVVEDKQMSTKDRLERKKYMGVCRWESEIVARMMSRFPSTVSRYMNRNSPKRIGWNLGSLEKP